MSAYIVDTETTDKDDPEVIELAYLHIPMCSPDQSRPPDVLFNERYKPDKAISFGAMAVHNILPEELYDSPPSAQAKLPDHCKWIIGHSIDFDWKALGRPDVKRICTFAMAQHVWPDADSYSQSALLYMLLGATNTTRILLHGAHGAGCDVENNFILLDHILKEKLELRSWSMLWEFSELCRIPLRMPITKARGELLTDIDMGLLEWCLAQNWLPAEHPYLHDGLMREYERREAKYYEDNNTPRF